MKRIKTFNTFIFEKTMVALGPTLNSTAYTNLKMGDAPAQDLINKPLLDDIEKAARAAKVHVLVTAANSDHNIHREFSRHSKGLAVDLAKIGDESVPFDKLQGSNGATKSNPNANPKFKEAGDRLADALVSLGYKIMTQDPDLKKKYGASVVSSEGQAGDRAIIWQYDSSNAGNHYNHIHVSNQADYSSSGEIKSFDSSNSKGLPTIGSSSQEAPEDSTENEPKGFGGFLMKGLKKAFGRGY